MAGAITAMSASNSFCGVSKGAVSFFSASLQGFSSAWIRSFSGFSPRTAPMRRKAGRMAAMAAQSPCAPASCRS